MGIEAAGGGRHGRRDGRRNADGPRGRRGLRSFAASAALALVWVAAIAAEMPSAATASTGAADAKASHAYVLADNALARASESNVPKVERLIATYKRALIGECRRSAAGSPQNSESWRMSYEVAGALWSITYGADAGAIDRFWKKVKGLRWSDAAIGEKVDAYARTLIGLSKLRMPDVCADVAAWRESSYEHVPAQTLRFDERAEALEPYVLPARMIAPYLERGEQTTVKQTEALEEKLLKAETLVGGNTWYSLLEALGLNS